MGSGKYFLKAGADAPETLLGYADFDGTVANNPKKGPLKTFSPHVGDWASGDPVWQGSKGKGLIGAISYLSSKGCNAFSFLTYNAGGDGDNVWPFIERNDKLHYDCSKTMTTSQRIRKIPPPGFLPVLMAETLATNESSIFVNWSLGSGIISRSIGILAKRIPSRPSNRSI